MNFLRLKNGIEATKKLFLEHFTVLCRSYSNHVVTHFETSGGYPKHEFLRLKNGIEATKKAFFRTTNSCQYNNKIK
jgi:hypothetical protein